MTSSTPRYPRGLVWFRRDLRAVDHAALHHALRSCERVWCLFVFDTDILEPLLARGLVHDRRVEFIRDSVIELAAALREVATHDVLVVRHGSARTVVPQVAQELEVDAVFTNRDYELDAVERDAQVAADLERAGRALETYKDQVIFERDEVMTKGGTPFSVFTPYKNAWLAKVTPFFVSSYPIERHARSFAPLPPHVAQAIPTLASMGFAQTNLSQLELPTGSSGAHTLFDAFADEMGDYRDARNFPARRATSYLSVHLRFGTISIRSLARVALDRAQRGPATGAKGAETWLSELIWRDFYVQVLHHRPDLARGASFKAKFDRVRWVDGAEGERRFDAWCRGATGYPLVDAAMTQINTSGFMHNRLRMVTASFLSKHLGLDWRRGERYFAEQLNDFDLSANNGGWQWAASSGCDAQPWFRIFNPILQSQRFDPDGAFIRRYLPGTRDAFDEGVARAVAGVVRELAKAGIVLGRDYPEPIVDHETARRETLERYAVVRA